MSRRIEKHKYQLLRCALKPGLITITGNNKESKPIRLIIEQIIKVDNDIKRDEIKFKKKVVRESVEK